MTSKRGEGSVERVAADANVLLSAICGKAALKVFTRASVEVVTTEQALSEVREYLPEMARRYKMMPEVLESQLKLLAVKVYKPREYKDKLAEARRRIGGRDPEDIELLALAVSLRIPVWSNDNDFEDSGVEWYTTAFLLKKLGL